MTDASTSSPVLPDRLLIYILNERKEPIKIPIHAINKKSSTLQLLFPPLIKITNSMIERVPKSIRTRLFNNEELFNEFIVAKGETVPDLKTAILTNIIKNNIDIIIKTVFPTEQTYINNQMLYLNPSWDPTQWELENVSSSIRKTIYEWRDAVKNTEPSWQSIFNINQNTTASKDVQQPASKDVQQPASKDVQQPASKDVQQPASNDVQQPASKDVQQPASKDVQQPASKDVQQPASKDVQQRPFGYKSIFSTMCLRKLLKPYTDISEINRLNDIVVYKSANDGNCFFYSIAYLTGTPMNKLREIVAHNILNNDERKGLFIAYESAMNNIIPNITDVQLRQYIMSKKFWGNEFAIQAIHESELNINVFVMSNNNNCTVLQVNNIDEFKDDNNTVVVYLSENHYEPVIINKYGVWSGIPQWVNLLFDAVRTPRQNGGYPAHRWPSNSYPSRWDFRTAAQHPLFIIDVIISPKKEPVQHIEDEKNKKISCDMRYKRVIRAYDTWRGTKRNKSTNSNKTRKNMY